MTEPALVVAAGAVVLRTREDRSQVLLVHRPKYDDWSFPKGKLDPGESARTAAVREVLEETGVQVRLGPPLPDQAYLYGPRLDRTKVVHYWAGYARGDDDVSSYAPNAEIDGVRWVDLQEAAELLSYSRDRAVLEVAKPFVPESHPLLVLRHAQAHDRRTWQSNDRKRPLTEHGERQASLLPPTLEAYGVQRLVASSSRRCWTTLTPYGVAAELEIEVTDTLSEEDATSDGVADELDWVVELGEAAVVCTHRPVLPLVFEALGVDQPRLDLAAMLVVHHRDGLITAIERVPAPGCG